MALPFDFFNTCQEGKTYHDFQNRFEVPCVFKKAEKTEYGVVFRSNLGMTFNVAAYDIPPDAAKDSAIELTKQGVRMLLEGADIKLRIIREEPIVYRGYKSLNFDFTRDGWTYISRFVQTDHYVYWVYSAHSNEDKFIEPAYYEIVEKDFDQVKFEKEFGSGKK